MITRNLIFTILTIIIGSSFQFGYETGVLNTPLKLIETFINETRGEGVIFTDEEIHLISSVMVSGFPVGGLFGALTGGFLANKFGRKLTLLLTFFPTALGSVLMLISDTIKWYPSIIIGRIVIGFACGIYTCLAPIYLSEIASLQNKGASGTIHQFAIVFGLLTSQILGMKYLLGTPDLIKYLLGFPLVPGIIQVGLLLFCPESPKYLLLTKEDEDSARKALTFLRQTTRIDEEIEEMMKEKHLSMRHKTLSLKSIFSRRYLRLGVWISIGMHLSQQLTGINTVIFYSNEIFENAGFNADEAMFATIGVGLTNLAITFVSIILVDRLGRKTLHLAGLSGMFFSVIVLSFTMIFKAYSIALVYIAMVFIYVFVGSFSIGPGSVPWFIVAELFTQESRSAAASIAIFVNWLGQIAIGVGYPLLMIYLGKFNFLPFVGTLLIFIIFTYKCVPETKNKTPDEMERYFKQKVDGLELDGEQLLTNTTIGPILSDDYDYRI